MSESLSTFKSSSTLIEEAIRLRAFYLYLDRIALGKEGSAEDDWYQSEALLSLINDFE